jgi:hypothetical protein
VVRLHARSCLVAREILTLLQSGYPSGAHSRWRTLHELSVAAQFIHDHGDSIALRYLEHDDIQRYKAALGMQRHATALREDPPTEKELQGLKVRRDELRATYGPDFANDYGWAAPAVSNGGRSFAEIEAAVGLEYLRPYYKMASHAIHPNARGSYFDLGGNDDENLVAGPSTRGLADPGTSACISLFHCTCQFLGEGLDLDEWLAISVLEILLGTVTNAFQVAHDEHERRAASTSR